MCVAKNLSELGKTDQIEMDIELIGDEVVQAKPYRLNARDREDLNKIIDEYKKLGIVKETNSSFASPVFIVRKRDGTPRMVIDYRSLNKITKVVQYPIPNFDDWLEELNDAKYFITLDLASGYLQMPLSESAKEKTAFITETQTGQFERAMFGLVNAPRYFAKLMDKTLGIARRKGIAFNFFDDICIHANSWDNLMNNFRLVLDQLKTVGLTLNLDKCKFGMRKVEYVGYILGDGEMRPSEKNILAIKNFPCPQSKHDIRRFIGLASFYRRFIPKFATLASPLTSLTKNDVLFEWGEKQNTAFVTLKNKLLSEPVLKLYNPHACRTELHTDASAVGLGAMLLQADKDTDALRLVYAISRCTNEAEQKYHSSKLELMAISWALERLRSFLIGLKFVVYTDCYSIVHINTWKTKNSQISRWMSLISEFDLEIKHRPGERMQHVDALSRAPVMNESEDNIDLALSVMNIETNEDEILVFQRSDPSVLNIIKILQKKEKGRDKFERNQVKDFILRDGLLFKKVKRNGKEFQLFVVPKAMRKSLVIRYHNLKSHFGVEKTVKSIEQYFYFPRVRRYVRKHISMCIECILAKRKVGPGQGELHVIPSGRKPFDIVHVDHVGPFITTPRGNNYILGIIDNLTKFVYAVPVKNVKAVATTNALIKFVDQYGAPGRIISDRGRCYTSHQFQEFCLKHGIRHTLNSSRHPQANGLIERLNQTLIPLLKISTNNGEKNNWDVELKKIIRDINCSVNVATGKTPYECLLGYLPRFDDGKFRHITTHLETYTPPREIQEEIRANIAKEQAKYKLRYDKNRYKDVKLKLGDIVYMKRNPVCTGYSTKLQAAFNGPLVVVSICPSDTYRVKYLNESGDRGYTTTAHISQLKIWNCHKEHNESDDESDSESNPESESDSVSVVNSDEDKPHNNNNFSTIEEGEKQLDSGIEKKKVLPRRLTRNLKPRHLDDYVLD